MDRLTARKVLRRAAFALIIFCQLTHFPLQVHHIWTFPRRTLPKTSTLAKVTELCYITICSYKISECSVDVKLGRVLICGWGIEALLWGIAVWSVALVGLDVWWIESAVMSLSQLCAVDVLMWTEMLSSAVGLVEREGAGEGEDVDEKMGLELNEKGEV